MSIPDKQKQVFRIRSQTGVADYAKITTSLSVA